MRVRLDKMRDAMRKMQDITTGILSLERIEQMAQNSTDKVFNLSELVRKTASEHEDDAIEKGQNFSQDVAATPLYINGDALQLHEAISNLMSNAIKYTPKGGDVSVYLEAEASQVVFRVVDTGFGVPQAQQKRLFEPFFRAKTDETANIEGTGLGLHLVKNIIERHGGEMVFESEYNTGSTFGFRLPLVPPPPNSGRDDLNSMRTMMVG
jgi:signal transduction histidine kinase